MTVKEPKPEGAVRYGKCPECGEEDWLFKWEGDEPLCEGCIDEAHARMHEAAEDYDAVDFDEEWEDEDYAH